MTVSGSSKSTAATSRRTRPRPREIFCLASAVSPEARVRRLAESSRISATSATRFRTSGSGIFRLRSGKARLSKTVMVS